jgi:hypothetical protein
MFPESLDWLLFFVCLTSVSCEKNSTTDNLETLETSGKKDTEVRQRKHNRQSRDTGNIRNTRHRSKTNKAQLTIQRQWKHQEIERCALFVLPLCLVFLMFPVSLDCPMFCLPSVSSVPDVSSVSRLSVVLFFLLLCLVFLMFPVSLDCPMFCLTDKQSTTDNPETVETSGTQDTEVRQTKTNRQPRDTGVSRLSNVLSSLCVLCS